LKSQPRATFSAQRIASRVAALGKQISREYQGRRLDVLVTLDRGFIFAADLIRNISAPVVCHFVREEVRDVHHDGHARREVLFGSHPELKGRDVLVVDAVLESGVTQDFLLRRLGEQAAFDPPGCPSRQAGQAPRGSGAGLLWLPDGI